jgi:hypothetical protein
MRVASSAVAIVRRVAALTARTVLAATLGRLRGVFHAHTSTNSSRV